MSVTKFAKAQADLNQQVADLSAAFGNLVAEIQKSGIHFPGFAKLKRSGFALEKIAKQNGIHSRKQRKSAEPNNHIFDRTAPAVPQKRESKPPAAPPNLFDRTAKQAVETPGVKNPPPPNLFVRSGPNTPPAPVPKKKKPAPKGEAVKVLATSEDKDD